MPVSKKRKKSKKAAGNTKVHHPTTIAPSTTKSSPTWYIVIMAATMVIGLALILFRYILDLGQIFLFVGLVLLAGGFLMTTNYR